MNDHLHPIFAAALAPFAPPPKLRAYMVRVKRNGEVICSFEAMGADSCSVVEQHLGMCGPGEKLDVMSLGAWRDDLSRACSVRRPE